MRASDVIAEYERTARAAAGVPEIVRLPGNHFLQENQAEPLAERIAAFVSATRS
jgi:hypothetical protein